MKFLLMILLFLPVLSFANAQPMENIQTTIIEKNTDSAVIQITWNYDDNVKLYKIGCVSCQPNTEQTTTADNIILRNVTPLPNGDIVLYLLSVDSNDEIITGKQIILPFS